jgi:hypothetical protein
MIAQVPMANAQTRSSSVHVVRLQSGAFSTETPRSQPTHLERANKSEHGPVFGLWGVGISLLLFQLHWP